MTTAPEFPPGLPSFQLWAQRLLAAAAAVFAFIQRQRHEARLAGAADQKQERFAPGFPCIRDAVFQVADGTQLLLAGLGDHVTGAHALLVGVGHRRQPVAVDLAPEVARARPPWLLWVLRRVKETREHT